VAVSSSGTNNRVMTSPDGITWTSRTSAADNFWRSVTYGNGLFVAVSSTGIDCVMTSPDGITWTSRTSAADNSWLSVTYGNGLFVAVAYDGTDRVMTSPDGITWTSRTSAADNTWPSVTYGNGLFVAVAGSGTGNRVMTSLIGTTIFDGTSAQEITGTLTAASAFGHLTIANTSGDGATQSVSFGAPVTVSDTFTMLASTSASFQAGATSTFGSVDWQGSTESPVWLRSSSDDSEWYLDIPGEQLNVDYVNVKDSSASSTVTATHSTDSGNNTGWDFVVGSTGSSTLSNHTATQVDNAFSFQNTTNGALFAFNLTPESGTTTVTDLTLSILGTKSINTADFSSLRLFRDHDSDAQYDATDEVVGGTGTMTIEGQTGTITFTEDFLSTTTQNYLVVADWNAPVNGSYLLLALLTTGLIIVDDNGTEDIYGSVTSIQHNRNNKGGGGSGSGGASAVGGDASAGHGTVTGGTDDGGASVGDAEIPGEQIGDPANYRWPTTHSGTWNNAAYAYDRTNNTHATTSDAEALASFLNHSFSVPGTNVIMGIEVKLEVSASTGAGNIGVQLSYDGGNSWTTTKTTDTLTTSDVIATLGGAADTWGRVWTPANFTNANFVVRLTGNPSTNMVRVDGLVVRVYHQAGGGGAGGGGLVYNRLPKIPRELTAGQVRRSK
jgi:hypothetical protein